MNVYFTSYRCNCAVLEQTTGEIPSRCPVHDSEIIYGLSGAHEQVQVDAWQPLGLFKKPVEGVAA
jgi:hypothetical protein